MALCINLKSVQVSLRASLAERSWKLLFWGSKEEYANCTIRERFLSIFWAFIWCFQRHHCIKKKCHIWVEPKHQHFKPSYAIWVCHEWSPSFTNVKLIWKCGKLYVHYLCLCFISFRDVFWKLRQTLEHLGQCSESSRHFRLSTSTSFISMTIQCKYIQYCKLAAILRRRTNKNYIIRQLSFGINFSRRSKQAEIHFINCILIKLLEEFISSLIITFTGDWVTFGIRVLTLKISLFLIIEYLGQRKIKWTSSSIRLDPQRGKCLLSIESR